MSFTVTSKYENFFEINSLKGNSRIESQNGETLKEEPAIQLAQQVINSSTIDSNRSLEEFEFELKENASIFNKPWNELTLAEKVELIIGGIFLGLPYAAYKGVGYCARAALEKLSCLKDYTQYVLKQIGQAIKLIVAKIKEKSFQAAQYLIDSVLLPLCEKVKRIVHSIYQYTAQAVQFAGEKLKDASSWTYEHILTPLGHLIQTVVSEISDFATLVWNKTIDGFQFAGEKLKDGAIWTYEHILTPLGHLIQTVASKIIEVANLVWNKAIENLQFAGEKLKDASSWIYEHILTPLGHLIQTVVSKIADVATLVWSKTIEGFQFAGEKLKDASSWIYEHILTPLGHLIQTVVSKIADLATLVWNKTIEGLQFAGEKLKDASSWIYEHILTPLGHLIQTVVSKIADVATLVWSKTIEGLQFAGEKAKEASLWIKDSILVPFLNLIAKAGKTAGDSIMRFVQLIWKEIVLGASKVQAGANWSYEHVIVPSAHFVSVVCIQTLEVLKYLKDIISEKLSQGYTFVSHLVSNAFEKGKKTMSSIKDRYIQPLYNRSCEKINDLYQNTIWPAAEKVNHFVIETIPEWGERSIKRSKEAFNNITERVYQSSNYFFGYHSPKAA